MIRKVVLAVFFGLSGLAGFAQQRMPNQVNTYSDEGSGTGFQKENLFLGGSLGLGFGSYDFNVGVNPEIGFSLNKWLDAGVVVNFNYNSIRADPYYNGNVRSREFIYGGGVFGRAYVLPFLFLTAQPEFNWLSVNQKDMNSGFSGTYSANAPSLLLGIGYGQRIVGQGTFYIALMFDAIDNVNSPYNDINGHPLPILRAGVDFYLHKRR
ncbi:MAG TPA: hypothetical protein VGM30_06780 [Puia sp.]|jgi:hypothetical protein